MLPYFERGELAKLFSPNWVGTDRGSKHPVAKSGWRRLLYPQGCTIPGEKMGVLQMGRESLGSLCAANSVFILPFLLLGLLGCPPPGPDPCAGVTCSDSGYCENVAGQAVCRCDPGHAGDDCSECTWAGPGEPCEPDSPRDLFDMAALKTLGLDALGWTEETETTSPEGVTVLVGSWSGGILDGFDARGTRRQIDLREKAALYLPPGFPSTPHPGMGFVQAAHLSNSVESEEGVFLALHFGIPVLFHGEKPDDWARLGFSGRNELVEVTFQNMMNVNPCELVSITRGNFVYILARTNILAITLLGRLVEQRGGTIEHVALRGGSKEGFASWITSAVDDRVEVAGPGGYQMEDLVFGLQAFEDNWGCEGQDPGWASVEELLTFKDWLTRTPAGSAAQKIFSVEAFKDLLYPRLFLIAGDVTHSGMHDGNYFPLGVETPFLKRFTGKPFRYDRRPDFTREEEQVRQARLKALLAESFLEGGGSEAAYFPKILGASLGVSGGRIRALAQTTDSAESVRLWWCWSEDRVWNEPGNAPWVSVEMSRDGAGWVSPWVDVPAGMVIGWYVETENRVAMGPVEFARYDTSPVEFIRLTDPLSCTFEPPAWCTP